MYVKHYSLSLTANSGWVPVMYTLSDPAKSTKWTLPTFCCSAEVGSPCFGALLDRWITVNVTIAWDRELWALMLVAPTVRFLSPRHRKSQVTKDNRRRSQVTRGNRRSQGVTGGGHSSIVRIGYRWGHH